APRQGDRLEARVHAECSEDVADVVPHGLDAEMELGRDLVRRASLLEQPQDLGLTGRQVRMLRGWRLVDLDVDDLSEHPDHVAVDHVGRHAHRLQRTSDVVAHLAQARHFTECALRRRAASSQAASASTAGRGTYAQSTSPASRMYTRPSSSNRMARSDSRATQPSTVRMSDARSVLGLMQTSTSATSSSSFTETAQRERRSVARRAAPARSGSSNWTVSVSP